MTASEEIADRLVELGNSIGALQEEEKNECEGLLRQYVNWMIDGYGVWRLLCTQFVQASLEDIMKDHKYDHLSKFTVNLLQSPDSAHL